MIRFRLLLGICGTLAGPALADTPADKPVVGIDPALDARQRAEAFASEAIHLAKPRQREARDVVAGRARGRQVGENLADHRRELKAVTGTG
jgi:hypothetical protein